MLSDGRGDQENNKDILQRNTYSKENKRKPITLHGMQAQSLSRVQHFCDAMDGSLPYSQINE